MAAPPRAMFNPPPNHGLWPPRPLLASRRWSVTAVIAWRSFCRAFKFLYISISEHCIGTLNNTSIHQDSLSCSSTLIVNLTSFAIPREVFGAP